MKVLIVGSGGVGESTAAIARRRDPKGELFETMVMADYDLAKAQAVSARLGDERRFPAAQVDASDVDAVAALCETHGVDLLCSFLPVKYNPFTLQAALKARVHHLDASTTLSVPHPTDPFNKAGKVLGEDEFALTPEFERIGKLALAGWGVEPGMSDWLCRYAADHYFDEIDEIGIRDGANLEIPGATGISFGFSIWMTIEECTNPAVCWERDRGFYTVPPLSEPEPFYLPEGIGWVECAHVEHEEVIAVGRTHELLKGVKKATFKYALGDEFIAAMDVFKSVGLHRTDPIRVGGCEVAPRDVVEAAAPDPNEIGKRYVGQTCGGTWVKGRKDGLDREVYLYQVADNEDCVAKYGTQGVVAQTAFTGVIAMELLATGKLAGYKGNPEAGVRVPQEFSADDFVAMMAAYEFPGGALEMDAPYKRAHDRALLLQP
ncbi:MAG: saccharopine dehydrogenase C-terminal domain-containing protein [Thermoleophilia bacterium]|jgi:saccharopine dehydrogenase-like NADP-dependent oxidoreductase|nr:saccharopine dehydrogenase C-terminal domain-containing protein [Thermoleophilia bacterium]